MRAVDRVLYVIFAAMMTLFAARAFYGYMLVQTGGEWSAPLDDVFIHFDYARATARGHPFQWSVGNGYSSGNTSLLYPFVLAAGYWVGFRGTSLMVWAGIVALWQQGEQLLSTLLFFFSIVFPTLKLLALAIIWFVKLSEDKRTVLLHWLGLLGKWSMLDVFVVAILIVLVKLGPFVKIEPRVGVYVFSAAIVASMLTTMHIDWLARRSLRSR